MAQRGGDCPTNDDLAAALRAIEKRLEFTQRREEVTLREFLEQRFTWLREVLERDIAANQREIETRLRGDDRALVLRTDAIEKHLQALNGEQARLAADRERFASREKVETERNDVLGRIDGLGKQLDQIRGREEGLSVAWKVALGLAALVPTLLWLLTILRGNVAVREPPIFPSSEIRAELPRPAATHV